MKCCQEPCSPVALLEGGAGVPGALLEGAQGKAFLLSPVPGAPPQSVSAFAESSTSLRVVWKPPPDNKQNGIIIYYKIFYVPSSRSDSEATVVEIKSPSSTEFVLDDLLKWTDYRVWMLAGTSVGDGPKSSPIVGRTDEDGEFLFKSRLLNSILGGLGEIYKSHPLSGIFQTLL